nr:MAG TPA: hypothetical protein [Caudoviricetes sp.]
MFSCLPRGSFNRRKTAKIRSPAYGVYLFTDFKINIRNDIRKNMTLHCF